MLNKRPYIFFCLWILLGLPVCNWEEDVIRRRHAEQWTNSNYPKLSLICDKFLKMTLMLLKHRSEKTKSTKYLKIKHWLTAFTFSCYILENAEVELRICCTKWLIIFAIQYYSIINILSVTVIYIKLKH